MPSFPGFGGGNPGTGGFLSSLVNNVAGSVANSLFPNSPFGGFGTKGTALGQTTSRQDGTNRRVTLGPRPAARDRVLGSGGGLLDPIRATNFQMTWPYTPSISYSQTVDYSQIDIAHANQNFHVYNRTPAPDITVDGTFTVQNQLEGRYAMACIHFMRTMSKMNFGANDPNAGTPPPILLFNAYGPYVFKDIPVIVKAFTVTFPEDVDYVQVSVNGVQTTTTPGSPAQAPVVVKPGDAGYNAATMLGPTQLSAGKPAVASKTNTQSQKYTVWLPSVFKISSTLTVQHTPNQLRTRFNLPAYRDGASNQGDFI
jgi:hypothetical protein